MSDDIVRIDTSDMNDASVENQEDTFSGIETYEFVLEKAIHALTKSRSKQFRPEGRMQMLDKTKTSTREDKGRQNATRQHKIRIGYKWHIG